MLALRLICVAALLAHVIGAYHMNRFNLTEVSPQAICNDGSSAVYYFAEGSGNGTNSWVIRLMGGGWCYDEYSCKSRQETSVQLTTSHGCPAELEGAGILNQEPGSNPFYNYNMVFLYYCTSDSNLGNKTSSESFNGWSFMGKTVIHSMVQHLLYGQTPSIQNATQILVTGDSAGAVSAINNADYIWDLIKGYVPNAHYRVFPDAGWFLDIPAYGNTSATFSFQKIARNMFTYFGAIYDESCMEFYGPGNEWHCFHAQYAWPHLQTLAFYQEFEFDKANLDMDGIRYPFTSSEQNFTENFQATMLAVTPKAPYLFLPNCYKHETIDSTLFTSVRIGQISIADAVYNWFTDYSEVPAVSHTIDGCQAFNCNPTCPPV